MKNNCFRRWLIGAFAAILITSYINPAVFAEYTDPNNTPVLFEEDFSNWTPSQEIFDSSKLETLSGGIVTADSSSSFKMTDDGALTSYKPMGVSGYGSTVRMAFSREISYDDFSSNLEINIDVKKDAIQDKNSDGTFTDATTDAGGQRTLSLYYNKEDGGTGSVGIIKMNDLGTLMRSTGTNPYYGTGSCAGTAGTDGYYSLKIVLSKEAASVNANGNTTGTLYDFDWAVRVYDRNNNNTLIYTHRYMESNPNIGVNQNVELPSVAGLSLSTYQGNASSSKSESRITVKNLSAKINAFEAVEPTNPTVAANAKYLNVVFTKNVAPTSANKNTITFTDSLGNNMATDYTVTDNTVNLSLEGIKYGESYTLNILPGLTSVDLENVIPARFSFESTIENQTPVLFREDFSVWSPSSQTFDKDELKSLSDGTMTGSSNLTYSKTSDGGLMIYDQYPVTSQSVTTYMSMGEQITYDEYKNELIFDIDIKPEPLQVRNSDGSYSDAKESYGGYRRLGLFYEDEEGSKHTVPIIHLTDIGKFSRVTGVAPYGGTPETPTAVTDSNGYASLRVTLYKENYTVTTTTTSHTYDWVLRVYDVNDENRMIYSHRYHAKSEESSHTILPAIKGMSITSYQPAASRSAGEARCIIRNPQITVNGFYAIEPTIREIDALSGSMNVTFTKDVSPGSINSDTLMLLDSNGNNVATGYNINNKTVTILYDTLTVGEKYSLYIMPGIKSTEDDDVYTAIHNYTAVNIEKLFEQDFSSIPEDYSFTISELASDINPQLGATSGSSQTYIIKDGTLTLVNANEENENLSMYLKKPVTAGTVTAYLKLKALPAESLYGSHSRTITATDSNGITKELITLSYDGKSLFYSSPSAYTSTGSHGNSYTPASFITSNEFSSQFIDIKLVLSRSLPDEKWSVAIYDNNSSTFEPKTISYINAGMDDINSINLNLWRDPAGRQITDGVSNTNAPLAIKSAYIYRTNDSGAGWGGSIETGKSAIFGFIDNTVKWKTGIYSYGADNNPVDIYIAAYDANNALLGATTIKHSGFSDIEGILDIDSELGTIDHAKMMIWDEDLFPLINTVEQSDTWTIPSDYAQHIEYYVESSIGNDISSVNVIPENFHAVNGNTNTEVPIDKVTYSPLTGILRIYFSNSISNLTDTVYVTSENLTKLDGTTYNYSSQRSVKAVVDNRTEDIFIADVTANTQKYSVNVINSGTETETKNLIVFGIKDGKSTILSNQEITLRPFSNKSVTENFSDSTVLSNIGNKIYAMMW